MGSMNPFALLLLSLFVTASFAEKLPALSDDERRKLDKQVDSVPPQYLGTMLCDQWIEDPETIKNIDGFEKQVTQTDNPDMRKIFEESLKTTRLELVRRRYLMQRGRAVYELKLGAPFAKSFCKKPESAPASDPDPHDRASEEDKKKTPADLQAEGCALSKMGVLYEKQLAELSDPKSKKKLPPKLQKPLEYEFLDKIIETDRQIARKQALFVAATGKEMDLTGCDGKKRTSKRSLLDEALFKRGCFYYLGYGGIRHYFVGHILEGVDGSHQYGALGECHQKSCEDETAFLEKAHKENRLGEYMKALDFHPRPLCTDSVDAFLKALLEGKQAVRPDDDRFHDLGQGLGFALVPFTCGMTKPCLQATRRAWKAIEEELGRKN